MRREHRQSARRGAAHTPQAVVDAIAQVVAYLWREEAADYQGRETGERRGHIFRDLVVIRRWLKRNSVPTDNA